MSTFHILTQYIWPDAAPTGLYAEHLATRLHDEGQTVRLVGGIGRYRSSTRDKPPVPLWQLEHYRGRRGRLSQVLAEYASVQRAFVTYIERFVKPNDVVVVTSAPPSTVQLARTIRRRDAHAIYWLQDYYPELIRGIYEYPAGLRRALSAYWDGQLAHWNCVVKIGANLGGPSQNAVVIRNWPTISFSSRTQPEPGTALYSGNFGYGHDLNSFVAACDRLRDSGYRLTVRADGRGVRALPSWLNVQPLHSSPEDLRADLFRHEIHLIAAHPRIQRAIFPSKIWNSLAAGRELVCTGFAGEMSCELEASRTARFECHLDQWLELLLPLAEVRQKPLAIAA